MAISLSLLPQVMGKASIVNCVITLESLAAQLLNVVVGFERPDLEERRRDLVQQMSANRQALMDGHRSYIYIRILICYKEYVMMYIFLGRNVPL